MEGQVEKNERFRRLLLFAFNQGSNATRAARDICAVYGDGATADRIARDWCAKFKNGTFDLRDAPSGRPAELDEERLEQLLHENSRQTTTELAEKMLSHCHGKTSSFAGKGSKLLIFVVDIEAWVLHASVSTTKINEPQSSLVCLLVTAQPMDTSNEFFIESLLVSSSCGVRTSIKSK
ncbi:hypothetical protein RB195_001452 [Necator americanus]|uniref:Mos1 transposase HTH domain-containing protein n=1 Tax=Necator americanus TaxID=51031 RepID=A0ABR1DF87_NECAM